jgi:hypothetical protein
MAIFLFWSRTAAIVLQRSSNVQKKLCQYVGAMIPPATIGNADRIHVSINYRFYFADFFLFTAHSDLTPEDSVHQQAMHIRREKR